MKPRIHIVFTIIVFFIFTDPIAALPKFAVSDGVQCGQCHVDAQGGGLRNSYGAEYFSQNVLPMSDWGKFGSEDFTTQFNEFVRLGGDVRLQFYRYAESDNAASAFFPMQADAYVNIQPSDRLQFFLEQSLFQNAAATDVWGQYNLPEDAGYLRVGQFLPSYGMRLDDHTAFIRGGNAGGIAVKESIASIPENLQGLHWKPGNQTVGIEGMMHPFGLQLTGSIGKPRGGSLYSATIDLSHAFWVGDMNFLAGSSFFTGDLPGAGRRYNYFGMYGGLNYGRFTYLGELDFTSDYSGLGTNGFVAFSQLSIQLLDGLDLVGGYHLYDPNTEFTGINLTRISLGADIIPVAYIELKPQYRILTAAADPEFSKSELIIQSHFWF